MRSTPARSAAFITARVPSTLVRDDVAVGIARPQPVIGGDMKQKAHAGHGARERRGVAKIALDDLERRIGDIDPRTGRAHQRAHLITGLQRGWRATAEPTKPLAPVTRIIVDPSLSFDVVQ